MAYRPQIVSTLEDCATDVIARCDAKRLQLNADKAEVMWFRSAAKLSMLPPASISIRVSSISGQPLTVFRKMKEKRLSWLTMLSLLVA